MSDRENQHRRLEQDHRHQQEVLHGILERAEAAERRVLELEAEVARLDAELAHLEWGEAA